MSELRELLAEAWEHRSDGYWWADNQLLAVALTAVLAGSIGFVFKWMELELEARYGA